MSSSLGTGFVALTPINLDVVPGPLEGSKAGLLSLNWALVHAANHAYVQPINLLQAYWTGQFSTCQAVLIDNSQVPYAVQIVSQSTYQRVVCPAYTQQMTPLLVSVAATFTISLIVPPNVTTPVDQVTTQIYFLNTPQTPYSQSGSAPTAHTLSSAGPVGLTGSTIPQNTLYTVATLAPAFTPGGGYETYVSLALTVSLVQPFQETSVGNGNCTVTFQTSHGGTVTWQSSAFVPSGTSAGGPPIFNVNFTYPDGVNDTTGDPILLQASFVMSGVGANVITWLTGNYTFYYASVF